MNIVALHSFPYPYLIIITSQNENYNTLLLLALPGPLIQQFSYEHETPFLNTQPLTPEQVGYMGAGYYYTQAFWNITGKHDNRPLKETERKKTRARAKGGR